MTRLKNQSLRLLLLLFMAIGLIPLASAETITVNGTVTDATGETVIGASILIKGEKFGTTTDIDGRYSIKADSNGTLVFSSIGYETQEVRIDGRTTIDVVMQENNALLNEVVVIGYGTMDK